MKYKITPEIKKYIEEVSKQLPEKSLDVPSYLLVKGSTLLSNKVSIPKGFSSINRESTYQLSLGKAKVNHLKKLRKEFEKAGMEGIRKYVDLHTK